jgi:4-hydroxythreonine-4-phosphate dehydrogenase
LHGIDVDQIILENKCFKSLREGVDLVFGVNDVKIGEYAVKSFVAATAALKKVWSMF